MVTKSHGAFGWIRSSVLRDGACLTLVAPASEGKVVRGFGGKPRGAAREGSLASVGAPPVDQPVIAVRDLGSWLLVVEPNGWQGSRPEVLRRVSAGGRAVSCYWNVNGTARFSYAVRGRVLTTFDLVTPDQRHGADPDCLEHARAGLPWDSDEPVPVMLALASRVTGLHAGPRWLDGDFTVMPVRPVPDDAQPAIYPPAEPLTYDDGPLAWALLHAGPDAWRRVARIAARYAADATAGAAPAPGGERHNRARLHWAEAARREAGNRNPLAAAFRSVDAAYSCLQSLSLPDAELRADLMSALGNPAPPAGSLGLTAMAGSWPEDRYLWTGVHWLAPAGALWFVRGAPLDEVASCLGSDTGSAREGIPALSREVVTAFRREGDWLVAVEGRSLPAAPARRESRPLPAGTTTVSLHWTARGRSWVRYLAGDTLVAALDPQRPGRDQRMGTDPAFLDQYTADLRIPFPPEGYAAAQLPVMLAIAERVTGLAFAPPWLDERHVLMNLPRTRC